MNSCLTATKEEDKSLYCETERCKNRILVAKSALLDQNLLLKKRLKTLKSNISNIELLDLNTQSDYEHVSGPNVICRNYNGSYPPPTNCKFTWDMLGSRNHFPNHLLSCMTLNFNHLKKKQKVKFSVDTKINGMIILLLQLV